MKQIGGYLRPVTAAQYLGIPLAEIQAMLESGELPGIQIAGQWRIPLDQLEAWLDEEVTSQELKSLAKRLKDVDTKKLDEFVQQAGPVGKKSTKKRAKTKKSSAKKRAKSSKKR